MTSTSIVRRPRAMAGALACAVLVSGCNWISAAPTTSDATAAASGIVEDAKAAADRVLTAARDGLGFGSAAVPAEPAPEPPPAARPVARAPRPPQAPPPAAGPALEPVPVQETPLALVPVPPLATPAAPAVERPAPAAAPAPSTTLYSRADAGVAPPSWRAAMVSAPQLTGSTQHVPALELIVGTDGAVERARLLQGSRQLTDMMILSSAKMWQFEPATMDGTPVRYRLVVRLSEGQSLE